MFRYTFITNFCLFVDLQTGARKGKNLFTFNVNAV